MSDELLLHETPLVRAFFRRLKCLLRGGHRYGVVERIFADTYWACDQICAHCRHMKWWNEPIEENNA